MSSTVRKGGHEEDEEGLGEKPQTDWKQVLVIAIIIALLVAMGYSSISLMHPTTPTQPGTATAVIPPAQVAQATPEPVTCLPFSDERRTCTFGSAGSIGLGAEVGGHVCLDQAYGTNQTYRFQYWDSSHGQWQDFDAEHDPEVFSTVRFIANPSVNWVTVTYWKSDSLCASNDSDNEPSDDESQSEEGEEVIIVH